MASNKIDIWDGAEYSQNSSVQFETAIKFLHEQRFEGNESVLDVGCGDGKITHEIALLVAKGQVLGVDASPNMLKVAEQKFQRDNVKFQLEDAQTLPFNSQFEVVTTFFCLQWVPNKLAAFNGIVKSLKKEGRVIAIFPTVARLSEITNEVMNSSRWKKYFVNFGDPLITARDIQYDVYATQAGLTITQYKIEPIKTSFPSKKAIYAWLYAVTPHLIKLPTAQEKQDFIEDAIDIHLQEFPENKDGTCDAEFTLIKLLAKN